MVTIMNAPAPNAPAPNAPAANKPLPERGRRPVPSSPPYGLAGLGLRPRDLAHFAGEVRLNDDGALLARHRDAADLPLGWEKVWIGPDGGLQYRYARGRSKGLFRSPPAGAGRLVLACGAVPVVAAAACDAHRAGSCHAGVGGAWTPAAADAVAAVIRRGAASRVVLAFAATPAGRAMVARALADLAGLPAELEVLEPPRGTWLATLRARRLPDGELP